MPTAENQVMIYNDIGVSISQISDSKDLIIAKLVVYKLAENEVRKMVLHTVFEIKQELTVFLNF